MNTVKIIDVRGLEHSKRESLIFPSIDELKEQETLRVIFEFNPMPLVYMLNAKGGFDIAYEKEGPDEWILNIKKVASKENKKEAFKELLKELKEDKISEATKEKAKKILQSVDVTTLGFIEQELIKEGVSHDEIRKSLCDIHLDVLRDTLVSKRIEVSAPHPVNTLMEEHKVILNSLSELKGLIERLKNKNNFKDMADDMEKLKDIAHHLVEAENHHQREEDVLFPSLEKHNVVEPPNIMKLDHLEFRKRKQELFKIANNSEQYEFTDFKKKIIGLGEYLTKELESHIFKEDNILYQIALQILTKEEWGEVKKGCDKIGYCCFTPADQENSKIVELDLRQMPPFERHEKIFNIWDNLKSGYTLKIINDHDPKPLHYQFEAEQKGKYEWEYIEKGPKDWSVQIKRIK
ncbi:MAG: DUF438 domain-containing protein [Candidatus Firestonebacteria bacterium]